MKFIKNNIYPILLFIFTLVISLLIPRMGDDWLNLLTNGFSFSEIIDHSINYYMYWEGRIFSRIALCLLVPNQIIWAIINAGLMTAFYVMIIKIIGVKYKKILYPLILLVILALEPSTFAQMYIWKTGNITYFIPLVYMIYLIYIRRGLLEGDEIKYSKLEYLLIPLTFVLSMFIETISVGIILVCLFNILINYFKNKKIDMVMILCLISSILGTLVMSLSPGNFVRMKIYTIFNEMNLFEKICFNLSNFLRYTFMEVPFTILFSLIIIFLFINSNIKSKLLKVVLMLYIGSIPVLTLLGDFITYFVKIQLFIYIEDFTRFDIKLFWIMYIIIFIVSLFWYFKKYKEYKSLYFILIGLFTNLAMLISPVWDGRTGFLTYIMFSISFIIIIFNINIKIFDNKPFKIFSNIIIISFMIVFTLYSIYINHEDKIRNKYLNYQIENNNDTYELLYLPTYYMWGVDIWSSEGPFAESFKTSYGIPLNARITTVERDKINVDLDNLKTSDKIKTKVPEKIDKERNKEFLKDVVKRLY